MTTTGAGTTRTKRQPPGLGEAPRYPHMEWAYANGFSKKVSRPGALTLGLNGSCGIYAGCDYTFRDGLPYATGSDGAPAGLIARDPFVERLTKNVLERFKTRVERT